MPAGLALAVSFASAFDGSGLPRIGERAGPAPRAAKFSWVFRLFHRAICARVKKNFYASSSCPRRRRSPSTTILTRAARLHLGHALPDPRAPPDERRVRIPDVPRTCRTSNGGKNGEGGI